MYNYVLKDDI